MMTSLQDWIDGQCAVCGHDCDHDHPSDCWDRAAKRLAIPRELISVMPGYREPGMVFHLGDKLAAKMDSFLARAATK